MNFENNIGFICRTENEWYECQKILFSKNIYWLSNNNRLRSPWAGLSTNKTKDILKTKDIYPMLILINSKEKTTYLTYIPLESWLMLKYKHVPDMTYEANVLLRKYKLEKINLT